MLYLGKRDPGGLTASSPGDTLVFPFSTYNDSGASIGIGGTLAVSDIEVLKNGQPTVRATDSGYSLISDTGQVADRLGLHRVSIQIFNTADDTGFYDEGSSYQVLVDSITVDSRTVRFWLGTFEIGTTRANLVEINSDTGQAIHLGQFADEYDTGRIAAEASATLDTGAINQAVWAADASRTLTGWSFDTGVQQAIARLDTGLRDVIADLDTGLRDHVVDYATDTGLRDFISDIDTGLRGHIDNVDTGIHDIIVDLDTGLRGYIDSLDTGVNETIDRILSDTDTGIQPPTVAQIVDGVWDERDTGHADTGTYGRLRPAMTAVKSKTDSLTFTQSGNIDANIQYVNSTLVGGTGDTGAGTPWGPA